MDAKLQCLVDQVNQILDMRFFLIAGGFDCIPVHREIFRAGNDKSLYSIQGSGFTDA